jgi:DNA-binding beta-propeller fold protein YncE
MDQRRVVGSALVALRASCSRRPGAFFLALGALIFGCSQGTNETGFFRGSTAPRNAPRPVEARFVDVDGNGPDEGDVVLLTFHRAVVLVGSRPTAIVARGAAETLGEGARLQQSLPASTVVELVLGRDPVLVAGTPSTAGVTRLNVAASGEGLVRVQGTNGVLAGPARRDLVLLDATNLRPRLLEARYVDADNGCAVSAGDLIVAAFDKPVGIEAGDTVAGNFELPVAGDSFGAGAVLVDATTLVTNRVVSIRLGDGAALSEPGGFDAGDVQAGEASGLRVGPAPTLSDRLEVGSRDIAAGVDVDIAAAPATSFGNGRESEVVLGAPDPSATAVTAQGLHEPSAMDFFSGDIEVGGEVMAASLLFLCDRENDRVLIFADFPSGDFPAARWVLGQPDFASGAPDDPTLPRPKDASASRLRRPSGVAFDADQNRLFVADTGHHRVLVWDGLFGLDAGGGGLDLDNGRAATFVLGQPGFASCDANRGDPRPSGGSFSSPSGLSLAGGRLAVADSGNHRVLIFGSSPDSAAALPGAVLGQADFSSGDANRGGAPDAGSLSSPADVFLSTQAIVPGVLGLVLVADTGNHRVLFFSTASPGTGAEADVVFGQPDKTSARPGLSENALDSPRGVAADSIGGARIFAADSGNHRVMVYRPVGGVFRDGQAGRPVGQAEPDDGEPNRGGAPGPATLQSPERVEVSAATTLVSDAGNHRVLAYVGLTPPFVDEEADLVVGQPSFAAATPNARRLNRPADALLVGGRFLIADSANHRVLVYSSLPAGGDPDPELVLGQPDLFSTRPNRGGAASAGTMRFPSALATDGVRISVADSGNHRVLVWSAIPAAGQDGAPADTVLGQPSVEATSPNAGGGRQAGSFHFPDGVAFLDDHLFVADRENHRILVFRGLAGLATGAAADLVLGQSDFTSGDENRGREPSSRGLSRPRGLLAVAGRLFAADSGNHRVLVWSAPPARSGEAARGVFGQPDLDTVLSVPASPRSLRSPAGLSMDMTEGFLVVSDSEDHRLVFFDGLRGAPRAAQPVASAVLGQPDALSGRANAGLNAPNRATLRGPRGLFFNGYELLAADQGNGRVLTFR